MLDPSTLEKTNVQLANSFFHESTINALRYYANHGHPEFKGTADVLQIIRNWFNTVNVRSEFEGQRTRDPHRNPVKKDNPEPTKSFLKKFLSWVQRWEASKKAGLSKQTFEALKLTTRTLIELIDYVFETKPIDYLLLGKSTQDPLEGRFGWDRQLNGGAGGYQSACRQFLSAEKTIRVRLLVKSGFNMTEIKDIFSPSECETKNNDTLDFL